MVLEHVTLGHVVASVGDAVGLTLVGVVCRVGKVVHEGGGHFIFIILPAGC